MTGPDRFQPRPLLAVIDAVADSFEWPRSRPARVLHGDRARMTRGLVLCTSEAAIGSIDAGADVAALLAVPPAPGGGRTGRRNYDPFADAGRGGDVATWRREERPVLDAALLVAGGRGGIDEMLAEACGIEPLPGASTPRALRSVARDLVKLVAYVPVEHADAVCHAMWRAGGGHIGTYDRCSWRTDGIGTFRPLEGSAPTVGQLGELERVAESRCELVVGTRLLPAVLDAMVEAHPYEEPAYDVLDMQVPAPVGFGRLGRTGNGGGKQVWDALAAIDDELTVHGRPDRVDVDATAAIYTGAMRDVLVPVLDTDDVQLLVVGSATDAELELAAARGVATLVVDRTRALDAYADRIAGHLSRRLSLPVTIAGAMRFPTASEPLAAVAAAAADPSNGTWRLHFDGGSRGNPGPAAYGWVLYGPDGSEVDADGVRVGRATNNVAEWTGLLRGLEHAAELGIRTLDVRGDSELVVKQVTGVYRVKNEALKPLAEQVATILRRFDRVDVAHVYRTDNARADELANEALDGVR